MKCVLTYHPSHILRGQWRKLSLVAEDIRKAMAQSWTPELRLRPVDYKPYPTPAEAAAVLRIGDKRPLIVDIETASLAKDAAIVCVGVGREEAQAVCLPFRPPYTWMLQAALADPSSEKVGHNLAFDFSRLKQVFGRLPAGEWMDTLLAHSLVEPDLEHNLEEVASLYYDRHPWKTDETDTLEQYNNKDVDATARSRTGLLAKMKAYGVDGLFRSRVMPCLPVVMGMKERGLGIDRGRLEAVRAELEVEAEAAAVQAWKIVEGLTDRQARAGGAEREAERLEAEAEGLDRPGTKREAGKLRTRARKLREGAVLLRRPNLGSLKQLKEVFKDARLDASAESLDDDALVELFRKTQHPIIQPLRKWRECSKAVGTYLSFEADELHPDWLMHGTGTGRLSCQNPNVQNIPVRREWAWKIRSCYVPFKRGNLFTKADYSQIERRIQAIIWKEWGLLEVFAAGGDVHADAASKLFGVPLGEVTWLQRYFAKRTVYGESYGMGYLKLQRELAAEGHYVSPPEAKRLLEALRGIYPGIAAGREETIETARRARYLRNAFGRIRHFYTDAYGDALNFHPQSDAADVVLGAMLRLKLPPECFLVMQVHDELVVEHPPGQTERVRAALRGAMEAEVPELSRYVFPVELKTGPNYAFKEV